MSLQSCLFVLLFAAFPRNVHLNLLCVHAVVEKSTGFLYSVMWHYVLRTGRTTDPLAV